MTAEESRRNGAAAAAAAAAWPVHLMLAAALAGAIAWAWPRPAPAARASSKRGTPGLVLKFEVGGATDARVVRLPALYVPARTPPTPFLAAGPFRATFEADLNMRIKDEMTFSLAGRGKATLSINGEVVLEREGDDLSGASSKPVQLNKGKNRVVLAYASPPGGRDDAFVRLYWAGADFPAEPAPPTVFTHEPTDPAAVAGTRLREGRLLFAELQCSKCHNAGPALADAVAAAAPLLAPEGFDPAKVAAMPMPELAKDAPSLAGIGSRLTVAWMAHWIGNPRHLRPDATMPKVFEQAPPAQEGQDPPVAPEAAHVAAFLATLKEGQPAPAAPPPMDEETVAAGGRLFARRHCNACHLLPDAEQMSDELDRVSLRHVKAKFAPGALVAFLKAPAAHYAWVRMPDFKFTDVEAQRLAAFLLSRQGKALELPADVRGDPKQGEELLRSSGCLNCHSIRPPSAPVTATATATTTTTLTSLLVAPDLSAITKDRAGSGCLGADASSRGKAPDFGLTGAQREALAAFLATDRSSLARESLAEFSQRQVHRLNCRACHARDSQSETYLQVEAEVAPLIADGVEDEPQGEEDEKFSPDQSLPNLTWSGEKLRPEWSAPFIAGKLTTRYRPWLRARMPAFATRGALIARGWPLEHGFNWVGEPPVAPDAALAAAGKKLVGKDGGFACMTCHGVGGTKPNGVFDAPGLNLRHAKDRVTWHYYRRWAYNPIRVHRESKMPSFVDGEGKTSIVETLGGDGRKQYEAIWHYLQAGQSIEAPSN